MYDPKIGRWLMEDPLGFEAGDVNLYRYVGNDPTDKTDPSGLAEEASFDQWKNKHWETDGKYISVILDKETIAKWHNKWKVLDLEVYQSDYFKNTESIMINVAYFYAKFGIKVDWRTTKIHTFRTGEPKWIWCGTVGVPGASQGGVVVRGNHPLHNHIAFLRFNTSPEKNVDLKKEPDLNWFWSHFPHKPSVFFVGEIKQKGEGSLLTAMSSDVGGDTFYNTFSFIPVSRGLAWLMGRPYETNVAHEIGHILGLEHSPVGLMSLGFISGLDRATLSKTEVNEMRDSTWLKPVKDPKPGK